MPLQERLLSRLTVQPDGCVTWDGAASKSGYGTIRGQAPHTAHVGAHRAMWQLFRGPIPAGLQIDHLCQNRLCVNLGHMELVTARENILRSTGPAAINAQKTVCVRGHDDWRWMASRRERRCRSCERERYTR